MSAVRWTAGISRELPGWALRGILCAAASAFWAAMVGFRQPLEIAGMVTGVAAWVACFAIACAWLPSRPAPLPPTSVRALKAAAWCKIGLSVAGALPLFLGTILELGSAFVAIAFGLDTLLGAAAL